MGFNRPTILKDVLYNLDPKSGTSKDYACGVLVGVVSTLVAQGHEFNESVRAVFPYLPKSIMEGAIPETWQTDFAKAKEHHD
jgi:hypothetical protein